MHTNDNMKLLTTSEIKKIQLEILDSIHHFCINNNLRYSLAFGSLLGAVRHKGYIPWDDDIDIMMPRPDYEQFCKLYNGYKKNHTVQTYENDQSYYLAFAKVYDNRTEEIIFPTRTGVFVDVFPIDGLPLDESERILYGKKKLKLIFYDVLYTCKNNAYRPGNKWFNAIKYVGKRLLYPSRSRAIKKINNLCLQYPYETSEYVDIVTGYSNDRGVKKDIFERYIIVDYEDIKVNIIKDYDTMLVKWFGDYMKLPPKEQQVPGHKTNVYWKENIKK